MTKVFKSFLLVVVFVSATGIYSCSKLCDEGYEGKRCDVEMRVKFIGVWNGVDNPGGFTFTDTISNGTGIIDVLILRRFGADTFNRSVKATVNGTTISIARQKPESSRTLEIQGIGTINSDGNIINWNYDLIDTTVSPILITSYTGVWTK